MKIFFIGDIVGRSGREAVIKSLPSLKLKLKYDQRSIFFIERKFDKSSIFNFKTIFHSVFDLLKIRLNY